MKEGMTLPELSQTILRHASGKVDLVAPTSAITFSRDDEKKDIRIHVGADHILGLTKNASSQTTDYLDIPRRFATMLDDKHPELLVHNLNELMHKKEGRRLVRTLEGSARANLSDSFWMLDNEVVFDGLYPAISRMGAEIKSCNVSDDYLQIQALFPKIEGEIRKGDVVQFGFNLKNSEVGLSSLGLYPLIYRLVCTNGMIAQDYSKRKIHAGGSYLEGTDLSWVALSKETQVLKMKATIAEMGEYLEAMAKPENFQKILGKFREVADQPLPAEPVQVVDNLAIRYSLSKGEKDSALLALAGANDYTRWGLANSITFVANSVESYDRAVELEGIGGGIMSLSGQEYKSLAKPPKGAILEGEVVGA
jgi:hypothetical protein